MRPNEVPRRDWSLYYNNTIMQHDRFGIVSVQQSESNLLYRGNGDWRVADPSELECVWPTACAINYASRGLYIARRARREARRSASVGHYYVGWSPASVGDSCSVAMLRYLCFPDAYPTYDFAFEALLSNSRESVAVSPEMILVASHQDNCCEVVYKTEMAGTLERRDRGYSFEPLVEGTPAARRAAFRLQKEGLLCR